MRLIKCTAEIRYTESTPEIFKFREKIINPLAGKSVNLSHITDGVEFYIDKKNIRVVVQSVRTGADIILTSSIPNATEYAKNNLQKTFKQINSSLNIYEIQRIGIRGIWIHKLDIDMQKIVDLFKKKFFNSSSQLLKESVDLGIVLNFKIKNRKINLTFGPMNNTQFNQSIDLAEKAFPDIKLNMGIPENFVFIDFDYFLEGSQKYNDNTFSTFFEEAISEAKKMIDVIIKDLEIK